MAPAPNTFGPGWLAVSVNDNKAILNNGAYTVIKNPQPDTLALIDLRQSPPALIVEIDIPAASVQGPPVTVAITPDESLALIGSALKNDPANPDKQIDDTRVTVVDLTVTPPKVLAVLESGAQPAGISITPDGKTALVANRSAGSVSVFSINGKQVIKTATVQIADAKAGTSHVVITPDGKTGLVTRDGDSFVSVLAIDNGVVTYTKRDISAGIRPYGISMNPNGRNAVAANVGRGGGDVDTLSVIDLTQAPYRVVDTVSVGQTPEGIMFSPDGQYLAIIAMNGSNKSRESPFYNDSGKLIIFRMDGIKLTRLSEAPIGHWSQGAVFSPDNKTLLVQNMVEKNLGIHSFDGVTVKDTGQRIALRAGAAAIRTAGMH